MNGSHRCRPIDGAFYESMVEALAAGNLEVWWTEGPDLQNTIARVFAWALVHNHQEVAGLVLANDGVEAAPFQLWPWVHKANKSSLILDVSVLRESRPL